jgi:predicted MFS family arabinose efflux permease
MTARPASDTTPPRPAWGRPALIAMICGALAVAVAMGVRQGLGVFTQPVSAALETGRAPFAFALALQNLVFGLVQPVVGALADRYGAGRVLIVSTGVYVLGLATAALSAGALGLTLSLGVLVGLGLSGTTYVTVLGAVGRLVPPERRSVAFGLVTAAGSFGMFVFAYGAQGLIDLFDWRGALWALAGVVALLVFTAVGIRGRFETAPGPGAAADIGFRRTVRCASADTSYWLLTAGFFVCGFHIAFVYVHLTAYLIDGGISGDIAALSLAFIGLANIFGSYLFGQLGQRWSKRWLLAFLYAARAVVIAALLLLPLTPSVALAFGLIFGFLWLATVPLTSGLVAQRFGTRYLSTLYGFVFLSHQVGSFLGVWLGGVAFDTTGSYTSVWIAGIVLGLAAAAIHVPIREAPHAELRQPA